MKKILFLCQFFYPEYISSATLPYQTAVALSESGYDVSVLCGYPKEYYDNKNVPLKEVINKIKIKRVRYVQASRRGFIGRIANYLSLTLSMAFHFFYLRKFDLLISYSNPPVLPIICVFSKFLFRNKFIFVSYDVYPEIAIATNSLNGNSPVVLVMKIINRMVFKNADRIVAISEDMQAFFKKNRLSNSINQIEVIHNWFDDNGWQFEKGTALTKSLFDVSYFGNMGVCQEFETLFECIEEIHSDSTVRFNFAGHGCKYKEFQEKTIKNGYRNVRFLGYLRGEKFLKELYESDLLFLSFESNLIGLASPSKIYSYYYIGRPIMAVVDEASHLGKEIMENQGFGVISPGDVKGMTNVIFKLRDDKVLRDSIGRKNRQLFNHMYSMEKGTQRYAAMIDALF